MPSRCLWLGIRDIRAGGNANDYILLVADWLGERLAAGQTLRTGPAGREEDVTECSLQPGGKVQRYWTEFRREGFPSSRLVKWRPAAGVACAFLLLVHRPRGAEKKLFFPTSAWREP